MLNLVRLKAVQNRDESAELNLKTQAKLSLFISEKVAAELVEKAGYGAGKTRRDAVRVACRGHRAKQWLVNETNTAYNQFIEHQYFLARMSHDCCRVVFSNSKKCWRKNVDV